ncbi:DUF2950 family protein [Neorhizobium sp. DT-125]|uniref:DUF2950 family protein n=1 Tax=Neorhizobium sp. DT-125 TaxID=3396163 RepID=UPI003F199E68
MKTGYRNILHTLTCAAVISAAMPVPAVHSQDAGEEMAISAFASPEEPPTFSSPEEAVAAFRSTVEEGDVDKLAALLGLDVAKTRAADGVMDAYAEIQAGLKEKLDVEDVNGRKVLEIGSERWPFPFPVSRGDDGRWAFDTYVGLEEVANRKVGANELSTIQTMQDYVAAQEQYALADHDGDGVLEYAPKLISTPGEQDGLYWPADAFGGEESPGGAALSDGDALQSARAGEGFNGYRYRILTRQGDVIAGGAHDYVINGNMIAGFGLVAWPVHYGVTGVRTFVVNKSGIIYEADLGEQTADIASKIETFNPNDDWQVVDD